MGTRDNKQNNMPMSFRVFFGVFMALFFIAIGIMLLTNWPIAMIYDPSWFWLRWVAGPIFILYGIFRGYRMIKGNPDQNEA